MEEEQRSHLLMYNLNYDRICDLEHLDRWETHDKISKKYYTGRLRTTYTA